MAHPAAQAEGPDHDPSRHECSGPLPATPLRVLIVEDDDVTIDHFARLLRLEGYEVRTALTVEGALRDVEQHPPDALILDLHLPLGDGLGLLRQLRAREALRETPVAIVTGDYFLDDRTAHHLGELGARVHFKPLWLDDLVTLVHELLHARR